MATLAIEQNNAHATTTTTTANTAIGSNIDNADENVKANVFANACGISKPITIPLNQSERFLSQLSTGSADSACVVNNGGQTPCSSFVSLTAVARRKDNAITERSASLSLHGSAHPKSQLQKLKQPAYRQLLSQDSGIDNDRDSAVGSQQQLKSTHCSSSSSESIGANSSGDLSHTKYSEETLESESSSGYSGSTHSFGSLVTSVPRRIKYKSCNSSTTLGCLGLEDRIDEVEDLHLDDNDEEEEDHDASPALCDGDDDEEDDPDDSGLQMTISPNPEIADEKECLLKPETTAKGLNTSSIPQEAANKSKDVQKRNKDQVLATDGNYYFPLLNISDDPFINPKLINKKDGLQDCMYYLDEFGSPKLREKYARKQKQKELKQQKMKAKKKLIPAEGLLPPEAVPSSTTKKRQCTLTTQECHEAQELHPLQPNNPSDPHQQTPPHLHNKSKNTTETHCDTKEEDSHVSYDKKSAESSSCKTHLQRDTVVPAPQAVAMAASKPEEDNKPADETTTEDGGNSLRKSSLTPSCVSWTKVVKKFKNILGKLKINIRVLLFPNLTTIKLYIKLLQIMRGHVRI